MVAATAPGPKKKNKVLKGLPVVKNKQPGVSHRKFRLNFHGIFTCTYEQMLWGLLFVGFCLVEHVARTGLLDPKFGYNFQRILLTLGLIYTADFVTKMVLDCFTNTKGRLVRWSGVVDDFIMTIYACLLPVVVHDPALHFYLLIARDFGIAVCADLIRIYWWPDNLHNRKRVANFQNILDAEGIWIWAMMVKTPICRALVEHICVRNFIHADGVWTINRILLFPIKVTFYEIITDFFYYWMHRTLHENKWLYKQIHKLHHRSKAPTAINSSTMSVSETFLTFLITDLWVPFLLVNIWPFDFTEFAMYAAWICAIEVYGHSGQILSMEEASVWRFGMSGLLSTFGIRLATRDHEIHHWNNTVNYSKRTQVWDKVFGTFDYLNQDLASEQALNNKKE